MGKSLGTLLSIAVAVFAPYAAAALGLTGFAATAFSFVAQGLVGALVSGTSLFGGGSGAGGPNDSGLLVNKQSTLGPVRIVYGERRIGAQRMYIDTTDVDGNLDDGGSDRDQYLHVYMAFAEGEIEAVKAVYFQDRLAWVHPSQLEGDPLKLKTTSPYYDAFPDEEFDAQGRNKYFDGVLTFAYYTGRSDQYVLGANATCKFNTEGTAGNNWTETPTWLSEDWTEAHRCRDVAVAFFRLKYARKIYPGVPNIQFDVDGKKVADVGGLTIIDDLLVRKNPSNVLYDYMTSDVYGKGLDAIDIDLQSFQDLRDYCVQKGLEVNGALDPTETIFNNTQHILSSANAFMVFSNGKYKVKPMGALNFTGAYEFNPDNIFGDVNISLGSKKNKNNRMKVNFFDPTSGFQPNIIHLPNPDDTPAENPMPGATENEFDQYYNEDSQIVNETQLDLLLSSDERQARAIGNFMLRQSRWQDVMSFKASFEALKLEVGDPVYVDYPNAGWTGANKKRFRVVSITLQQDATTDVVLLEYPDYDIYPADYTYE